MSNLSVLKYGIKIVDNTLTMTMTMTEKTRNDEAQLKDVASRSTAWPKPIYNPITTMGFLAMFTSQLDNTMRHSIAVMGV